MQDLVQRRHLRDMVAARIKTYIVENQLEPGDRLPTEQDLADRFGVSRISVREATKALGFLGILDAAPRRGLRLAKLNMQRVSEYLGFHFAMNDYPAQQLIDTRVIIETGALPHLVQRIADRPEILPEIAALNDQLRRARRLHDWIELDTAFHRELLDASGLEPLVAFNDLLQIFFRRFRESIKKAEWKEGIASHQRILEAIRGQDLAAASKELRGHIESHMARHRAPITARGK